MQLLALLQISCFRASICLSQMRPATVLAAHKAFSLPESLLAQSQAAATIPPAGFEQTSAPRFFATQAVLEDPTSLLQSYFPLSPTEQAARALVTIKRLEPSQLKRADPKPAFTQSCKTGCGQLLGHELPEEEV
jgi:hypothetical protein